jgi:hypothetical protein
MWKRTANQATMPQVHILFMQLLRSKESMIPSFEVSLSIPPSLLVQEIGTMTEAHSNLLRTHAIFALALRVFPVMFHPDS